MRLEPAKNGALRASAVSPREASAAGAFPGARRYKRRGAGREGFTRGPLSGGQCEFERRAKRHSGAAAGRGVDLHGAAEKVEALADAEEAEAVRAVNA